LFRSRRCSHQFLPFPSLETNSEAWNEHELEYLALEFGCNRRRGEQLDETEESSALPLHCVTLSDSVLQEISQELQYNERNLKINFL